ncbi:MAG TPA: hypothetical protein VGH28_32135 [Polyangiaceae bacterium]
MDSSICPACSGELYVVGYGCPECGHGRPAAEKRNPIPIAVGVAATVVAFGVMLLFTAGKVSREVAWAHFMLFAMGAIFAGGGAFALVRPKGLPLAKTDGTDAFGMTRYGETHASTAAEGRVQGAVLLVVGIIMTLLGAFVGLLTG